MIKVIPVSGKAQHGKDTFAEMLKSTLIETYKLTTDEVKIMHYGDFVKFIAAEYGGWDGQKDEAGRTLLQVIGTERGRYTVDPLIWVKMVEAAIGIFADKVKYVIIPDTRFPNEIEYFYNRVIGSQHVKTIPIRVERPDFDNGLTEEQKNHPSETSLDNYDDFVFKFSCYSLEDTKVAVWMTSKYLVNIG